MFEIGNSLREARLRQQLDFPELEQQTKVRAKYLRALEEEQFDALPAQTYVKGFLRTYAEALGLDGQLYVDEYSSRFVTGEDEPLVRPRRSTARARGPRLDARAVVITIGAIGVALALVIAAWKYGGERKQQYQGVNAPAPKTPATTRHAVPRKPARPVRRLPVLARTLLTAARGACWLQVYSETTSGPLLYEGTLEQGQKLPLVKRRLWVVAGNPSALSVRLNGRTRLLPGGEASGQFVITARGIARVTPRT